MAVSRTYPVHRMMRRDSPFEDLRDILTQPSGVANITSLRPRTCATGIRNGVTAAQHQPAHEPHAAPGDASGYDSCFIPKGITYFGRCRVATTAKHSVVSRQGLVAVTTWTVALHVPGTRASGTSRSGCCGCNLICGRGRAALVGSRTDEGSSSDSHRSGDVGLFYVLRGTCCRPYLETCIHCG